MVKYLDGLQDVQVKNFPANQPVSGTVNIGTIPEVEVKNDTGNPLNIQSMGSNLIQSDINTTPLGASSSYNTATIDVTNHRKLRGFVASDQATTLYFQSSDDGVSWYTTNSQSIAAQAVGAAVAFAFDTNSKYCRLSLINGATSQTRLKMVTYKSVQ